MLGSCGGVHRNIFAITKTPCPFRHAADRWKPAPQRTSSIDPSVCLAPALTGAWCSGTTFTVRQGSRRRGCHDRRGVHRLGVRQVPLEPSRRMQPYCLCAPPSTWVQGWRRSAAVAVRLACGDTLLSHYDNWSSKAFKTYHVKERSDDIETDASSVAELLASHRETSCIAKCCPLCTPPPVEFGTSQLSPPHRIRGMSLEIPRLHCRTVSLAQDSAATATRAECIHRTCAQEVSVRSVATL